MRGEVAVAGARQLPEAFVELEAEMGDLGAECERSGVAQEFRQFILQHSAPREGGAEGAEPEPEPQPRVGSGGVECSGGCGACARTFLYAHHIRTKQAKVYEWAEELALSGRVKIGWPGWIYIEGSLEAMATFTRRVKAEHWRKISPKWDEVVEAADGGPMPRLFPDGVRELEAAEFCEAFRRLGREDILAAGTGLAAGSAS